MTKSAHIKHKYNQLSFREKILSLSFLGVLLLVISEFSVTSLYNQLIKVQQENKELTEKIATEKKIIQMYQEYHGNAEEHKTNELTKAQLNLQNELQKIKSHTNQVLPSHELPSLLENILKSSRNLQLVQLKPMPPKSLETKIDLRDETEISPSQSSYRADQPIKKNGYTIQLKGDFFSILDFTKKIEQIQTKLFWKKFTYKVIEYPTAKVYIENYNLNVDLLGGDFEN